MLGALATLLLVACGATAGSGTRAGGTTTIASTPTTAAPRSLGEALARAGLTPIEPAVVGREMTHLDTTGPTVEGRRVTLNVSAGWNQSPPAFAQRPDGTVVLLAPRPTTIVDRHIPGGCRNFFGGRAWFERIVFELPEGTRYGGTEEIVWEEHVEVPDYTDTEADGSPCPPPALD